jgi:sugar phosphate isomerase/epimerase
LRYGLTPLEFVTAADNIFVDGALDFSRFNIIEIVRNALEIENIDVLEISMDIAYVIPGGLTPESINSLANLKDEFGHSYTVHLPFWSVELTTFNEPVRKGSVETIVDSIRLAEPLEPEYYVLHSTGSLAAEFSKLDFSKNIVDAICFAMAGFSATSVEEILTKSEITPQKIAVENVDFPFEVTRQIIDEYNLSICFDTGHLLAKFSGDESVIDFYKAHKDKIVELHLNDGTHKDVEGVSVTDDHLAIGTGDLPVHDFMIELVKDDFDGPMIFELTTEEVEESLQTIRSVVPEALEL